MFDFLSRFRSRFILALQTTASGTQAYLRPTGGVKSVILRCLVTMGNAADLVLSLKYADDASGTNAAAFAAASPINVDGAAVTAAKTYTVSASSGNFFVDFIVDPALIPEGKYVGISYANSNSGNLLAVEMIEDIAYIPTAS